MRLSPNVGTRKIVNSKVFSKKKFKINPYGVLINERYGYGKISGLKWTVIYNTECFKR